MPFKAHFISLFVLLSACSPMQSIGERSPDLGIVNGQEVTEPTALSSRIVYVYGQEGSDVFACTGSLLPGNIVLTAAHCVATGKQEMRIEFGRKVGSVEDPKPSEFRKVIARRHNPLHDQKDKFVKFSNDLALLKFEGNVPSGAVSFPAPSAWAPVGPLAATDKLFMIGYGITDIGHSDDGTLRATDLPETAIGNLGPAKNKSVIVLEQSLSGICEGDSGSPLVIMRDGKPVIVGVASAIVPLAGDKDPKAHECKGVSIFTRTGAQMKWINATYAELR